MMLKTVLVTFLIISVGLFQTTTAIGISTGICYAGCAGLVATCYSAAGFVFGTVTAGVGTPPAIIACNVAFGKCMTACTVATAITP